MGVFTWLIFYYIQILKKISFGHIPLGTCDICGDVVVVRQFLLLLLCFSPLPFL